MKQRILKEFPIADTFGIEVPANIMQTGYEEPSSRTPTTDPDYFIHKSWLSDFLAWYNNGRPDGLHIFGPTGAGKSSFVLQVCARLNIGVQRPPVHKHTTWSDLIGFYTLIDGDTVFQEGPLTLALKYGDILMLDEGDGTDPSVNMGLHAILEGAPLVIPQLGGLSIDASEGFGVVTTGNTSGAGDQTGFYPNAVQQSIALMDRFWVMETDYIEADIEKAIVKKTAPDLNDKTVERMVEYANTIRKIFNGTDAGNKNFDTLPQINVTFSTRSLARWARMTVMFKGVAATGISPIHHALDRALAFRAYPEARQGMHDIAQRIFGE